MQTTCPHCHTPLQNMPAGGTCPHCNHPIMHIATTGFPAKKVPLGGWLLLYFLFCILAVGSSVFTIVSSIIGGYFSIPQFGSTIVFTLLPSLMIVFHMLQRSLKFKRWLYFQSIIGLLAYVMLIALGFAIVFFGEGFSQAILLAVPDFPMGAINILGISLIGTSVVGSIIVVAWLVYFKKSRRVAYTFDPKNNPPR